MPIARLAQRFKALTASLSTSPLPVDRERVGLLATGIVVATGGGNDTAYTCSGCHEHAPARVHAEHCWHHQTCWRNIMRILAALSLALVAGTTSACADKPNDRSDTTTVVATASPAVFTSVELAMFAPLPVDMRATAPGETDAQTSLGRALFYETLLSDGHDVSCNSCHALNGWGADGRRVSFGHDGRAGTRNAPTVYNAAGHVAQFWDGRARDVEEQAKGPILNPIEMGMPDSTAVLAHLRSSPMYVAAFRAAFPDEPQPITYSNVGRAIGAFERRLTTPSRWDAYLAGDSAALTPAERVGLRTFLDAGCQGCHSGAYVGGDRYMKAGVVNAWYSQADSGRYHVTKDPKDLFVFKVPSLRNIDRTGPYFHDGSTATLTDAVRLMAHHQLGKELSPAQVESIVTWLGALTGTLPSRYIAYPQKP
jgi:cytochrome c peroxidase